MWFIEQINTWKCHKEISIFSVILISCGSLEESDLSCSSGLLWMTMIRGSWVIGMVLTSLWPASDSIGHNGLYEGLDTTWPGQIGVMSEHVGLSREIGHL